MAAGRIHALTGAATKEQFLLDIGDGGCLYDVAATMAYILRAGVFFNRHVRLSVLDAL